MLTPRAGTAGVVSFSSSTTWSPQLGFGLALACSELQLELAASKNSDLTQGANPAGMFLPAGYQAEGSALDSARRGGPVPESKPRKKTAAADKPASVSQAHKPNAVWFKPVMFGLMILGLLWIITFYISEGVLPVRDWGSWNIVAGFGIAIAGFLMTTRWRS
jgi:hypothetical protein